MDYTTGLEKARQILVLLLFLSLANFGYSQIGRILWQEDFNQLDNWNKEIGNGSWGWGNGELQYYKADNVSIVPVPGEAGNNALRIVAKSESGPDITDQWGNPLSYTSGRLNTKAKVSVKYGVVEVRMMVPDLRIGGWPAFWMLGTTNLGWPASGELDIMEMGQSKAFRDLHDAHNGGNDSDNSNVNQMAGANAIFYADAAITQENPSGAASLAWDPDDDFVRPYYNYSNPLAERFMIYRMYWDRDSIRFTVEDNNVEHDLYNRAFPIDSVSDEFRHPFYFVTNLAIGGNFTDAYSLGDPSTGLPVSMSLPAEMYVDYVKVMEWNGQGEVHLGPPTPQGGTFGIFTDSTPVNNGIVPGLDANIFAWEGTLEGGSIAPYEGDNVISWTSTGKGWFGGGIQSLQPINLLNFGDGSLNFRIKIAADVSFKIGIIDAWGNQNYVDFPANQTTYGLQRNGDWGQAMIPVSELRGLLIDLRMLSYEFVILETNGTPAAFAIDDIYWAGGTSTNLSEKLDPSILSLKNYPNPFHKATTISYKLPKDMEVEISVHDLQGRIIETLAKERQAAGLQQLQWQAGDRPAGIYYYKLKAGDYILYRKCILENR